MSETAESYHELDGQKPDNRIEVSIGGNPVMAFDVVEEYKGDGLYVEIEPTDYPTDPRCRFAAFTTDVCEIETPLETFTGKVSSVQIEKETVGLHIERRCPRCGEEYIEVRHPKNADHTLYVHEWTQTESMGPIAKGSDCCPVGRGSDE